MGIPVEIDNNEHSLLISREGITLKKDNNKIIIQKTDVLSLHTKNEEPLLLKIKTKDSKSLLLKLENSYTREIVKSLLLLIITVKDIHEEILNDEKDIYTAYNLLVDQKIITKEVFWSIFEDKIKEYKSKHSSFPKYTLEIENTKESLLNLFLDMPILLYVYCEMNITPSQFYNIFKQSSFYDIQNESNSIDRLINKYLNETKNESKFAKRINNFSEMIIQSQETEELKIKEQKHTEAEFEPIYPFENEGISQNMKIPLENSDNPCDINFIVEEEEFEYKADKHQLKKLVLISQLLIKAKNKKIKELNKYAIDISEEFISSLEAETKSKNIRNYYRRILPVNFINENKN